MADQSSNPGSKQADGNKDAGTSKGTPPDKEGMGASGGRTGSGAGSAGTDSAGGGERKGSGGQRNNKGMEESGDSSA